MSQPTLRIDRSRFQELRSYLETLDFKFEERPHQVFLAQKKGVAVSLYENGKVLIQGSDAAMNEKVAALVLTLGGGPVQKQEEKGAIRNPQSKIQNPKSKIHCGVDEAGRGPVIGPLVIGAVACDASVEAELKALGVRDSKACTPVERERLATEIRKRTNWKTLHVPAAEIDGMRESMTMNELEVRKFAGVVGMLFPPVEQSNPQSKIQNPQSPVVGLYLDAADVDEERFGRAVGERLEAMKLPVRFNITARHRGDSLFPAVSAASILAKVERDAAVRAIEAEMGLREGEIGSGYPSDPVTTAFLERWIKKNGVLPPETRHSWETARRLIESRRTGATTLERFGLQDGP